MFRPLLTVLLLGGMVLTSLGCNSQVKAVSAEDVHYKAQDKLFNAHKKILIKMGRMEKDFGDGYELLGVFGWHGDGNGYFGAYSFSQAAFEQAKRGWFLHGQVVEGSNELWPQDDWDDASQAHQIKFDKTIIGYTLPGMNMSWVENDKFMNGWFTAKVVDVKDNGHTLVLDKRAPHHAEQWHMEIVPGDWQNMCNCINNFGPPFVDGQPQVQP